MNGGKRGIGTTIRDDPINRGPYSPSWGPGHERGGRVQVPALPCVSLWPLSAGPLLLQLFVARRPRREENRRRRGDRERERERERERDRGTLLGPYILSSPERVAIISRQWPTDRSASQKDRGPIIAATHRPPRFGRFAPPPFHLLLRALLDSSSSPSRAVSSLIFLSRGEFLPFACLATRPTTLIGDLASYRSVKASLAKFNPLG